MLLSSTVEATPDRRLRMSWSKRTVPLKSSTLFNKVKHSEEWHRSVEATAGVLHPSDAKFPYLFLRNHTDAYLKKKGKSNQVDTDIRLSILIDAHEAKDIAIAAAAHAMTAKSLRVLLSSELNVAQGSYWGLDRWLQCLIAANNGNPASVTDPESQWAQILLPYANHGASAAGWYLKGTGRALRTLSTPSLDVLPEFSLLVQRAIVDYSTQLEGFRLNSGWLEAYDAVLWMKELNRSLPRLMPSRSASLENLFDSKFPMWRLWAQWRPDIDRITYLGSMDNAKTSLMTDLVALEGPDVVTGALHNLREGLIAQYEGVMPWIRYRNLVIEVPDCTKASLSIILRRIANSVETVSRVMASRKECESFFELFKEITITRPITEHNLSILEATIDIPYTSEIDIFSTIRKTIFDHESLGGQHILGLQHLIHVLDNPRAQKLRDVIDRPRLLCGLQRCMQDCQAVVRKLIAMNYDWMPLALELHSFGALITESNIVSSLLGSDVPGLPLLFPRKEQMLWLAEIYQAAQACVRVNEKRHQAQGQDRVSSTNQPLPAVQGLEGSRKARHPLEGSIEDFCNHYLLGGTIAHHNTQNTTNAILRVWESTCSTNVDVDRRSLAIIISKHIKYDNGLRERCLVDIATENKLLEPPTSVKDLLGIAIHAEDKIEQAIIDLTKLLTTRKAWTQCWKDLLYMWLEQADSPGGLRGTNMLQTSIRSMKAAEWLSFMHTLNTLFTDLPVPSSEERGIPTLLQPQLLSWVTQVSRYNRTLTRLEEGLDTRNTVQLILSCSKGLWTKNLVNILGSLERAEGKPSEPLMQKVAGKLSTKSENAWEIRECLSDILQATPEGIHLCEKIWQARHGFIDIPELRPELDPKAVPEAIPSEETFPKSTHEESVYQRSHKISQAVVEVMIAGVIQDGDIKAKDMVAIESVAGLLELKIHRYNVPAAKLSEAMIFWESIEAEIIKETERLEGLQKALKAADPGGTTALLQRLDVPDTSPLEEEIAALPAGIIDVVEKVGASEVEISFALSVVSELQRRAMGVPSTADTLLLRLFIDHTGVMPPSFCLHYSGEDRLETFDHAPWLCSQDSRAPQDHVCVSVQTAFIWQLNRTVHVQLRMGNTKIAVLYDLVKKKMEKMSHVCVSCGSTHSAKSARLRRSTPCNVLSCAQLWYQLPLEVRVPEIRTDTFAVDVMLTSVYAAAMSGRPELLPGCPFHNVEVVKTILNTLPTTTVLSHAVNLSTVLKSYHKDAEKLISWACVHFRGFLTTASGLCKIPNLPVGTHQFILANASPKLESQFVSKLPGHNPGTSVLFHGTSLDRLFAILAQGLKNCSGTNLQRIGAAHGKGIYLAEEPATSFTYAPTALSWRNSGLSNMRLLLGCEVVGGGRSVSPGIHVVTDEQSVMVRYVLLFTNSASSPVANHVVPAMASAMRSLRSGAV